MPAVSFTTAAHALVVDAFARRRSAAIALAIAGLAGVAVPALAQPAPTPDATVADAGAGSAETPDIPTTSSYVLVGEVNANDTLVRSGPSENDYPVMKLAAGTRLNVVASQRDWLKIEPPQGAFCLVSQAFVDKQGDGTTGKIINNTATVRVGSALYAQRMHRVPLLLEPGATVKIIKDQDEYYQIVPPQGVYLYIAKSAVTPVARAGEQANAAGGVHTPGGTTPAGSGETTAPPVTPVGNVGGISPASPNGDHVDPNNRFIATSDDPHAAAGNGVVGPPPTTAPAVDVTAIKALQDKLLQLEQQYLAAGKQPLADQPLDTLAKGYADLLADQNLPPNARRVAEIRANAIKIRQEAFAADVQTQASRQAAAQHQQELEAEQHELAQRVAETAVKHYTAIGKLAQSSLQFDNQPMYRLTDPANGRTIVYIRATAADAVTKVTGSVGQFVAINGKVVTDDARHITYIDPTAVDQADTKQVNTRLFADYTPPSLAVTNVAGATEGQ